MVDLALATPEMGAINIPVLHSLLHCLVYQLSMSAHRFEFHGANSQHMEELISSIPNPSPVNLKEFYVANPEAPHIRQDVSVPFKECPIKTIITINSTAVPKAKPPAGVAIAPMHILSAHDIETLKNRVTSIHDVLSFFVPVDELLLEANDENCQIGPLARMNRIINTAKRVDAVEISLRKMAQMVTYLAKSCGETCDGDKEISMGAKEKFMSITDYDQTTMPNSRVNNPIKNATDSNSIRKSLEQKTINFINQSAEKQPENNSIEKTDERNSIRKSLEHKTTNDIDISAEKNNGNNSTEKNIVIENASELKTEKTFIITSPEMKTEKTFIITSSEKKMDKDSSRTSKMSSRSSYKGQFPAIKDNEPIANPGLQIKQTSRIENNSMKKVSELKTEKTFIIQSSEKKSSEDSMSA